MQRKGINYDTGFTPFGTASSRTAFEPGQVRREMEVIARDLHCNAVRISGGDPERIAVAAEYALAEGLEVWFAPFPCNMTPDELEAYFAASAERAEALRRQTERVVFVLGCEMSLFNSGFVPGADAQERIQTMMSPAFWADPATSHGERIREFNAFLARAVAAVRGSFSGSVTYASGPWEGVNWSRFDFVGVDHYRDARNQDTYGAELRRYAVFQRPVVVTEFGCCTYQGAQDRGGIGWAIVDRTAQPPRLTEDVVRDEQVQADELAALLDILNAEGVDGAFWFTFAGYEYPYHSDPHYDLDCASYGVVKMLDGGATGEAYPGMPWEPKRSFYALAEYYGRL